MHVDALLRDAVVEIEEQIEGQEGVVIRRVESERPLSRVTLADEKGDQSSLLRALERTLYLVVRGKEGGWKFPATELDERESLKRVSNIHRSSRFDVI